MNKTAILKGLREIVFLIVILYLLVTVVQLKKDIEVLSLKVLIDVPYDKTVYENDTLSVYKDDTLVYKLH